MSGKYLIIFNETVDCVPLCLSATKNLQPQGHQQDTRSSAGKDVIHNRTVKIQFPVAVVTRQTETSH